MFFLLPYGNNRRTTRFPAVTYSLIALNILVFLAMLPANRQAAIHVFALWPSHPSIDTILTSMFIHAHIFHLAWNMLYLWLFGPNVEDALGHLEYAAFYFASGFAAALLHIFMIHTFTPWAADIPVVGASGAIAGVLGIFAVRFYKTGIRVFWYVGILVIPIRWGTFTIPAMYGLGIWFLQQVILGTVSLLSMRPGGVAYWSHIGGMVFGIILANAMRFVREGTKEYLMDDARTNIEQGATLGAAEKLRALLEHEPNNAGVHRELGNAYALQQDRESAIDHYQRCIKLHMQTGQCSDAIACFGELKHHFRNARLDLRAEYQLARYLSDSGCPEPAIQILEQIASDYPGAPEAEVSLMKAGDLSLNTLNDPGSALKYYTQFLEEYPLSQWRALVEKSLSEARGRLQ